MTSLASLASLDDEEILTRVQQLTARSNVTLADLLAHLGEVERRGIHRERACASLHTYCVYELRMSEDAAFRRSKAARLVREHPELHEMIAKGEVHLTGVLLIGPHLGGEHHREILQRARFRTKRELLCLIAEIDPKPEVPALVEPIGPAGAGRATHTAFVASLAGPVRALTIGQRPADWIAGDVASEEDNGCLPERDSEAEGTFAPGESPAATEPSRPLQYRVQFTATLEFVDLLAEARDLLGHSGARDLPDVQVRALRALVRELRASKRAAPARAAVGGEAAPARAEVGGEAAPARAEVGGEAAPARAEVGGEAAPARAEVGSEAAPARGAHGGRGDVADGPATRHIPASVRRAVYHRDGARCAYCDPRGVRCRETFGLEIHHLHAHALGGPPTVENLQLRCRSHNTLAAEEDFGKEYVDFMRGVRDCRTG